MDVRTLPAKDSIFDMSGVRWPEAPAAGLPQPLTAPKLLAQCLLFDYCSHAAESVRPPLHPYQTLMVRGRCNRCR